MTEKEWNEAKSPVSMLSLLGSSHSDRKWRLFGFHSCQSIRPVLHDDRSKQGLEVAERFIEGLASHAELQKAWRDARDARSKFDNLFVRFAVERTIANRAAEAVSDLLRKSARKAIQKILAAVLEASSEEASIRGVGRGLATQFREQKLKEESARLCQLVKEIFGNPFRPVAVDPRWLTSTVLDLARMIYDERAFERMSILADALMDTGCDNDDVLNHCRQPGDHVRGCWVVDLVTGRE